MQERLTFDELNDVFGKIANELDAIVMTERDIRNIPRFCRYPTVKRVIFNPPATIVFWTDNTKSVVKCQPGDIFDPEKGFVLAYLKKLLGNDNTFNKEINKWVKYEE